MDKSPNQCPLCGSDNNCAMASGDSEAACWCAAVTMPAQVFDALPEEERGRRCICRACAGAGRTSAGHTSAGHTSAGRTSAGHTSAGRTSTGGAEGERQ